MIIIRVSYRIFFPGWKKCRYGQQVHVPVSAPGPVDFHENLEIFKDKKCQIQL